MIKVRLTTNSNIIYKPNIGKEYLLVFIKGDCLAEFLGNECTSEYHIYENEELIGNLKQKPIINNENIKNELNELEIGKIVIIGKFKVEKTVLWGKNNMYYSIHGKPLLNDKIIYNSEVDKLQKNLDLMIEKYKIQKHIDKERLDLEIKKKQERIIEEEKRRIEIDGWDNSKPITKYNHPPEMNFPPQEWNGIKLEISKTNKSGYKYIYSYSNNKYYFKIDKYKHSESYDSPILASYNYTLIKNKEKEEKEKEKNMLKLFPTNVDLYCPFEEKEECKSYGGKWDNEKKIWYIPKGIDNEKFKKWLLPYININNYIEKNIIKWFCWKFYFIGFEKSYYPKNFGESSWTGLGKWLIIIDDNKLNNNELLYLEKQVGITGYKIWKEKRPEKKNYYEIKTSSICVYCGWKNINFNEQIDWINYIGYNLSKDKLLKKLSIRNKLYYKLNEDTNKNNYSFNKKNISKISLNFL